MVLYVNRFKSVHCKLYPSEEMCAGLQQYTRHQNNLYPSEEMCASLQQYTRHQKLKGSHACIIHCSIMKMIFLYIQQKKAINSVIFETILARQLEISVGENMNGPQKQKWCKYAKYFEELFFTTCTIYKDPCKYFFLPFKRKCCKYMYQ